MQLAKAAWIALGGTAIAGMAWFLFIRRPDQVPPRTTAGSEYVDSAACSGCHADVTKSYRLTGMARSLSRPRVGKMVEDFTVRNSLRHETSNRSYSMQEREGRFYIRRSQTGFGDKETNILERRIDYVIGSGNHARSYLHRTPEGRLIELPVSWYSEKGGYWAMSPGFDRTGQADFRRAVLHDCLFCHNGYPASGDASQADSSDAKFGDLPEGIDCQRCHGPGRAHIEAAMNDRTAKDAIRAAIVNPARLSRDRQLEICMQCHLETTSTRLPHMIRRYGRGPFSYRPGQPLAEYALFFDHAPGTALDNKFEIAHAAYRLRKSACFKSSEMTCTTCHNPHDVPRGEKAIQHYATACRTCHQAVHVSDNKKHSDCAPCHIPKRRAQDAVHVVMTDHYIQRRRPAGDPLVPLSENLKPYTGEVVLYYPPDLPRNTENELYLAVAQVQHDANLHAGTPRLQQAIESGQPARPEFYFELGKAWAKRGDLNKAITWHEEALRRNPVFRPAMTEVAGLYVATGQASRAVDLLEKAVAQLPPDSGLSTNLANAHLRQGNIERARQLLEEALRLDPDLPEACNLLGMISAQREDRPAAEKYFRHAILVNPDLAEAHHNLADLLASGRNFAEAAYHFEQAIAIKPLYAGAHYRYALVLLVLGNRSRALAELRETVRLDPRNTEARNDLKELLAAH